MSRCVIILFDFRSRVLFKYANKGGIVESYQSKGWSQLLNLCLNAESKEQLNSLFELLFTLEEKEQLALRVELVRELLEGKNTQREISRQLNISIAKITRGSNALKKIDLSLKQYMLDKFTTELPDELSEL